MDVPITAPSSLHLTDAAARRLREVAAAEGVDLGRTYLRVAVVEGGCSGLTYDLGWDPVLREDDRLVEVHGLQVALDRRSYLYLEGTTLDFSEGLEGKGFHFHNPQATRTCACGESFSL
jgi:iron-sulfur cluster assembly protein